jgi:hydroxyacylglutathione hydrolase
MIITRKNSTFASNTYIITKGNDCIVIDPGLDKDLILDTLNEYQLTPLAVIATHGHFDHIASVSDIIREHKVPYYLHNEDLKLSRSANFFLKLAKIDFKIDIPTPDFLFNGFSESIKIGIFDFKVFNFPGHSSGSCLFQFGENLFSGDTIYKNRVGFNNYPGEDKVKLKNSILKIFETFPDNSLILPGHGESDSLGSIKANNKELLDFLYN